MARKSPPKISAVLRVGLIRIPFLGTPDHSAGASAVAPRTQISASAIGPAGPGKLVGTLTCTPGAAASATPTNADATSANMAARPDQRLIPTPLDLRKPRPIAACCRAESFSRTPPKSSSPPHRKSGQCVTRKTPRNPWVTLTDERPPGRNLTHKNRPCHSSFQNPPQAPRPIFPRLLTDEALTARSGHQPKVTAAGREAALGPAHDRPTHT